MHIHKGFVGKAIAALAVVALLVGVVNPLKTLAAASVTINSINGQPYTGHCIAGPLSVVVSGQTGSAGGPYSIDIGDGHATSTTAVASGADTPFHNVTLGTFTPTQGGNIIIIYLYHGQPTGNDSHLFSVNQCVAAPTQGVVTVKKHVVNDNGGTATSSAFTLHFASQSFSGSENGQDFLLNPGTYSVTEDAHPGYNQTSVICSGNNATTTNGSVTVVAGENYSCIVTNDDAATPDTTPPVVTITPGTQTLEATSPSGAVGNYTVSALDTVDGDISGSATCTIASGATFALGTATVTCSATDAAGNTGSDSATVTVVDTTPPVITLNGSSSVNLTVGASYVDAGATAVDIVDGSVSVTTGGDTINTSVPGVYVITYNAIDAAGNPAVEKTRTVTVSDVNAPVINTQTNIVTEATGPAGATVTYPAVTATDDADGTIPTSCTPVSGSTFPLGTTQVACTATDSSGNVGAGVAFSVTVEDTTAPDVEISPDTQTLEATGPSGTPASFTVTATDIVDGDLSGSVSCNFATGDTFPLSTSTISCSVADSSGNTGSDTATVLVEDTTPPIITLTGAATLDVTQNTIYTDAGATAQDIVDGDLTASIVTSNPVDTSTLGTYRVTYDVSDAAGNPAVQVKRTVHVVAQPVENTLPLCTDGIDNDGDDLTDLADPDCAAFVPTLTVVKIVVNDNGGTKQVSDFPLFIDGSPVVSGATTTTTVGAHTVSETADPNYTATIGGDCDSSGNITLSAGDVKSCTITNDDTASGGGPTNNPPTITLNGANPMSLTVGDTFTDPGATASDVEDGDLTASIVMTGTVDTNTAGSYTRTYSVTDSGALGATTTRTVTVNTPTPPGGGGGGGGGNPPPGNGPIGGGGSGGPVGQVLGASTGPTGQVLGVSAEDCDQYLTSYIHIDRKNDSTQVSRLQRFLRDLEGFTDVSDTGIYDAASYKAVHAFQLRYAKDILAPWGATRSTGYVYYTTRKKINESYCKFTKEFPLTQQQLDEIARIKAMGDSAFPTQNTTVHPSVTPAPAGTSAPKETPTPDVGSIKKQSSSAAVINSVGQPKTGFWQRIGNFLKKIF